MSKKQKGKVAMPQVVSGHLFMEMRSLGDGEKCVTICACEEILAYSHDEIKVRHKKEVVALRGANLWCRTYGNHVAEVVGKIDDIAFLEVKK